MGSRLTSKQGRVRAAKPCRITRQLPVITIAIIAALSFAIRSIGYIKLSIPVSDC